jgi:hypothetical protein
MRRMDSTRRLRIANRIRIELQRELGVAVDVARMLRQRAEAAEVLFACKGLATPELLALAAQFETETRHEDAARLRAIAAAAVADSAPRSAARASIGSGFGFSKPPSRWDDSLHDEPALASSASPASRMVMHTRF